jgi:hypothetical protein
MHRRARRSAQTLGDMVGVAAILSAFLLPFVLLRRGAPPHVAFFASCAVVPVVGLIVEFVFRGGSGSLWAVAVVYGAIFGGVAAALGTFLAARMLRNERSRDA